MYYELYIDLLFLVNMMMDYLLLLASRSILSELVSHKRILLGASVGACITCLIVALPIPEPWIKVLLFHTMPNMAMILVGLNVKKARELFKAYILLYICGFFLGGIFTCLAQYVPLRYISVFVITAAVSYELLGALFRYVLYLLRIKGKRCQVELYLENGCLKTTALLDTGNTLKDVITGKPVSILQEEAFQKLCQDQGFHIWKQGDLPKALYGEERLQTRIRMIPFHSVGKQDGMMLAIRMDRMCLTGALQGEVKDPLVAICKESVAGDGSYEMIVSPDVI